MLAVTSPLSEAALAAEAAAAGEAPTVHRHRGGGTGRLSLYGGIALILGLIVQACSVIYLTVLIFAGARLAQQFRRHRKLAAAGTGGVGAAFIGFGVKLAGATLR